MDSKTYYIYHIPGVKIGCTYNIKQRIMNYKHPNYEILETHIDIFIASDREQELQKQLAMAESKHSLRRKLKESEVQQAQVVLASQDMVDQVQKMIEQVTSMQFKDLPALIDQIKNEVGVDQAQQFNADATAALAGLTQNLQGSKGQLETALGVVTGQAPAVPGADMAPAELPVPDVGAEELPAPEEEEESSDLEVSLGRGKR
jgi:membrane protease subunit (stomatin/prohibitin family)